MLFYCFGLKPKMWALIAFGLGDGWGEVNINIMHNCEHKLAATLKYSEVELHIVNGIGI